MTVKELKEIIADMPDDAKVYFEYDGPDTLTDIPAGKAIVNIEKDDAYESFILLMKGEN